MQEQARHRRHLWDVRGGWHAGWQSLLASGTIQRMGFTVAIELMRSEAERSDQLLSWQRPDRAFFAAGACHILAYRFYETHGTDEGWKLIHLRPKPGFLGSHVYVSTGEWALDFNGWTPEQHFLDETTRQCRHRWPDWDFDRVVLTESLESFCAVNRHRLPSEYAFDPTARADAVIRGLSARPPV